MEEGNLKMIDVTGKVIFLSGPMTGMPRYNVAAFAEANHDLKEAGAAYVFSPADRYLRQRQAVTALKTHADYMTDCLHELTDRKKRSQGWEEVIPRKYDMLVQLPGWESSEGARTECHVARACGIEVHGLEEVFA